MLTYRIRLSECRGGFSATIEDEAGRVFAWMTGVDEKKVLRGLTVVGLRRLSLKGDAGRVVRAVEGR